MVKQMADDPATEAVLTDLSSPKFRAGVIQNRWRVVSHEQPVLIIAVAGQKAAGEACEYGFRFELSGFPGSAPEVKMWDINNNCLLPAGERPAWSPRVVEAFKMWGDHNTVYRPWDRVGGPHNNWNRDHPHLAWHPNRGLTFILEDLHGLVTSGAMARLAQTNS
jgi:hypothetical protein